MVTATGTAMAEPPSYPMRMSIARPDSQSRLTNFPFFIGSFIRAILLIPHWIILYFFAIVAWLLYFIACFAILFSGRYPRGMYDFIVGYLRWSTNVTAYSYSLFDKYPPFSTEQQDYPLSFAVDYTPASSRILNFPLFIGSFIRLILLIPHFIVVWFVGVIAFLVLFIAQFAILFSGGFPAGMHGFVTGYLRWSTRLSAYFLGLTDRYPPFSLS
jgi:hypothetical protein